DDDSTVISDPALTVYANEQPTRLSAQRARVSRDGKVIRLSDDVRIVRDAGDGNPELTVTTTELVVYPDDEIARSTLPVNITQGRSTISGTGVEVNNREHTFKLFGRVHGAIYKSTSGTE
ncbi:MAG: LPS export ABC transporter periplasmic protein LptC, partial [Rhodocyclaceae bacterium]